MFYFSNLITAAVVKKKEKKKRMMMSLSMVDQRDLKAGVDDDGDADYLSR